jgi:hypothetical protein
MARISHQVFDSKGPRRGIVQRACQALGWSDGPEGVKGTDTTGGSGGGWTGGETSGNMSGEEGVKASGMRAVVQPENSAVVHPAPEIRVQTAEPSGELSGVELHAVDGRLIACRPGEPPPLSVRQHAQAFLDWLQAHDKVPGNEVPVVVMEHILYWDFLRETGLPMKSWRAVSDTLAKLPGVKKYQADWRDPTGEGPTPVVFKISRRRRAKVVRLAERREHPDASRERRHFSPGRL